MLDTIIAVFLILARFALGILAGIGAVTLIERQRNK